MAKKNTVTVKIKIDDDGNLSAVGKKAKKTAKNLDSTSKSARTADRNIKGTSKQSANATKNFSKMSQGMTGGLVPAYAVLASNIFALSAAFNFLKRASDVAILKDSQISYARNTGTAISTMTDRLREASGGMLGFQEAAQAAAIGVAKGFSSKQLEDLADGARKASTALGRDFQDSFDRLVRGASKAEPELLDELGITLRLEEATERYSTAINKNRDELTAAERSQAVLVETQRQLNEQFGDVDAAVNPFIRLSKTFQDLIRNITEFFLPALQGLANIIADNGKAAIVFFGLLSASIAKSILPVETIREKFTEFKKSQSASLAAAKTDIESYTASINRARSALASVQAEGREGIASSAYDTIAQTGNPNKSKILEKAAKGEALTGQDRGTLKRSLRAAEAQMKASGKVTKGIFQGVSQDILKSMSSAFEKTEIKSAGTARKISVFFKRATLRTKIAFRSLQAVATRTFSKIAGAAAFAGKAMNKAFKVFFIVGMLKMVYDGFMSLYRMPFTLAKGFLSALKAIGKGIEFILNTIAKGLINSINWVMDKATAGLNWAIRQYNKLAVNIPGLSVQEEMTAAKIKIDDEGVFQFADKFKKVLDGLLETDLFQKWKDNEEARKNAKAFEDRLKSLGRTAADTNKEIQDIVEGFSKEDITKVEKGMQRATAMSTLGVSGLIDSVKKTKINGKELTEKQINTAMNKLADSMPDLSKVSTKLFNALKKGDLEAAKKLESLAGAYIANVNQVKDSTTNIATQIESGNLLGAENFLNVASKAAKAGRKQAEELGIAADVFEKYQKMFEDVGGSEAFRKSLKRLRLEQEALSLSTIELNGKKSKLQFLTPLQKQEQEEQLNLQQAELNLRSASLKLSELEKALALEKASSQDPQELVKIKRKIAVSEKEVELQKTKVKNAERNADDIADIGETIGNSLESSMTTAFDGLIKGTVTAKQAFTDMATSILESLSKLIAQMLTLKLLESTIGGPVAEFLNFSTARYGGVVEPPSRRYGGITEAPSFSSGGVASGTDAGYPAVLHGTEAVVPLPNNREIPVDMKGAGQQNNVTVNVSVANDGQATQDTQTTSNQGANLGNAIAAAVKKELQNQKRSGGMLSPYGAA